MNKNEKLALACAEAEAVPLPSGYGVLVHDVEPEPATGRPAAVAVDVSYVSQGKRIGQMLVIPYEAMEPGVVSYRLAAMILDLEFEEGQPHQVGTTVTIEEVSE